ncbi:MAG TPA: S-methyl-5'-thioadenosine phosphorylase [Patescibacteria group bacterium]|nr:S-methyl-5'-thioadenosine phosphorylase [Patescibacteria group bacterium]
MSPASAEIGIIGGSGLYAVDSIEQLEELKIDTPFGQPSDHLMVGRMSGRRVAFLARHGRGHRLTPTEINYRANIYAMKSLGVERIVAAGAVGSMKEEIRPMDIVLPDQFFDRTRQRASTFFGEGLVAHVSFADPICSELRGRLSTAARGANARVHDGGTYLCMEGPQFSTRAESHVYRSWGVSVIGMTNLQEAKLAREAEICYATMALVTDYDCWHVSEEAVTTEMVIGYLNRNSATARRVIADVVAAMPAGRSCGCGSALAGAILTDPKSVPDATRRKLQLLVGKYLS